MNNTLHIDGKTVTLENMVRKAQEISFTLSGKAYTFRSHRLPDGSFLLERETAPGVWQRMSGATWQSGKERRVQLSNLEAKVSEPASESAHAPIQSALSPNAPMPGLIRQILVKAGEQVKQGQPLVVMEAMKLQITLPAGADAKVDAILVREGEMVSEGAELVRLVADTKK
jgi:3-methylcrotonyl-CoA carboxylase alpha subunit